MVILKREKKKLFSLANKLKQISSALAMHVARIALSNPMNWALPDLEAHFLAVITQLLHPITPTKAQQILSVFQSSLSMSDSSPFAIAIIGEVLEHAPHSVDNPSLLRILFNMLQRAVEIDVSNSACIICVVLRCDNILFLLWSERRTYVAQMCALLVHQHLVPAHC
jgi:hypothetical protein